MKKIIALIFARYLSNGRFQRIFDGLLMLCYYGTNRKNDGSLKYSGEKLALEIVRKYALKAQIEGVVIFDVGANVGSYAILANNVFKEMPTRIYSFEPSKFIFDQLKQNVNSFANIHINNFGLGELEGELPLYRSERNSGSSSLYDYSKLNLFDGKEAPITETVRIERLDRIFHQFGLTRITLLKLDIEGHEIFALRSSLKVLQSGLTDFIQFEFGGHCINSRVFFKDFWDLLSEKYWIYRMLPDAMFLIEKYSFKEEIFYTTNFFCVRKEICLQDQLYR